jgi:hypothetical protein
LLRQVVTSSSLRSMGYDRATQTLEIEFQGGKTYRYLGVPPDVWRGLQQAESKGQFFQSFVRDQFDAERVS